MDSPLQCSNSSPSCWRAAFGGLGKVLGGRENVEGKYADSEFGSTTFTEDASPVASEDGECPQVPLTVVKTLFLVRHGEAVHNVLEKEAQKRAAVEAEALGHQKGSDAYKAMLEMARKAVLHDAKQVDPQLSDAGKSQALATRGEFERLTSGPLQLPEPTGVLVSPLKRTLQTAAAVFPGHPNVRVHELVRERRTGLPCDEPSPQGEMCQQPCFSYMDFGNVLQAERQQQAEDADGSASQQAAKFTNDPRRSRSDTAIGDPEDAAKLRQRTAMLGELLRSTEDQALCVVTHKGYLRELERGPLGRPEAAEFGTGEVRVYQVSIAADGSMDATPLYIKGLHGEGDAAEGAGK
mmetsp:Transcript_83050/g.230645  ORF Transcript_83050/g.230645 Transcript_83050/m.230645 type:complete len:351 (-) Transcript_83050:93-1145(-)